MKRLNYQKGISPIIAVILLAVVLVIGGAYYFKQQQVKQAFKTNTANETTKVQNLPIQDRTSASVQNLYQNTTLGYELQLPSGWVACESSDIHSIVTIEKSKVCDISNLLSFTIYANNQTGKESFSAWVQSSANEDKKMAQSPDELLSELSTIDENTIVENRTYNTPNGTPKVSYQKLAYLKQPDDRIIIISTYRDNKSSVDSMLLEKFIPLLHSIPVASGDVGGQISWHNKDRSSAGGLDDYVDKIYNSDQKTIAAIFKTSNDSATYLARMKPGKYYFKHPDSGSFEEIQIQLGKLLRFNIDIEK